MCAVRLSCLQESSQDQPLLLSLRRLGIVPQGVPCSAGLSDAKTEDKNQAHSLMLVSSGMPRRRLLRAEHVHESPVAAG